MLVTLLVFVAVILAVVRRPWGLPAAVPATAGALVMLATGWVDGRDLWQIAGMT
jgi:Na+/H+ antiporter NhaD/arsenite permease-like protein